MKTLGPIGIQAFERRNISAETAVRYAIYTANREADGSVIPDGNGNRVVVVSRSLAGYATMAVTTEQGPDGVAAPTQQPELAGSIA